jgi:hypothetical protein
MRVEGAGDALSQLLFPEGLIPQILNLLVETWKTLTKPTEEEDEPKITNRFVKSMQQRSRAEGLKFRVMAHVKELEHLNETTGKGFAEIDILVPSGGDYRCYFAIEAKKLNTTNGANAWESQAGEYVGKDGMGCFVEGRYAPYQSQGGMVGYVMDGDCPKAKASITKAITKKAGELKAKMPDALGSSRHLPHSPHAFETMHALDRAAFTIHHLLLAA